MAERLRAAGPSLSGAMDAYAHALLQSFADSNFADSNSLFPELLRVRGQVPGPWRRTITEIHRLLLGAAAPYAGRIRRARRACLRLPGLGGGSSAPHSS